MVYTINDNLVFGTSFTITGDSPSILDIFGDVVPTTIAIRESDNNRNRDHSIDGLCCEVTRNMELGKNILALWREYVIRKSRELGITGQGTEQLEKFYLIECALLGGMLFEASSMVLEIPDSVVITSDIKIKFSNACLSADHIK